MVKLTLNLSCSELLVIFSLVIVYPVYAIDYEPGAETSFTLIKPLFIPARSASVYIQKNIVTGDESKIDHYYANCVFEQHALSKNGEFISPDTFLVTDTRLSRDHVTEGLYAYITLFYLQSKKNQKNYTLECQHWGEWADRYLTRKQIKNTVKGYFNISP